MKSKLENINALILLGGKSLRMGSDKSKLIYHKKPQQEHVYNLLCNFFPQEQIYYSVRKNQTIKNKKCITDKYPDLGPFGGILSAFEHDNTKAWFVIAIDLPFIEEKHLKTLFTNRDVLKIATTFKAKDKNFPEPLITIWEQQTYPILLKKLKQKKYSLTSILKHNPINSIAIDNYYIQNINTQQELKQLKTN